MKTALKILFSLGVTAALLEIVLRFIWVLPFTAKGAYLCRDDVADHSHYPYGIGRMKTGEFDVVLRMNNIGMRDEDVEIPKPAGEKRILILGDSFMEGWGNERGNIFTDRLEIELGDVNVVAAGVASWSPLAEFAWLKHKGMVVEPDAILLAIDATDPAGDSFYAHRLVRDAEGKPDFIMPGRHTFPIPEVRSSYIWRYVDRWLTKKFPVTEFDYGFWGETDDVWAPLRSETEIPSAEYDSYWKHTREALVALEDFCRERSIPLLIVQYPTGVETDTAAWATGRSTADFGDGMIPPRRFDYMNAMVQSDSLPYFSLLDTFQKHPDPAALFFPYDGHWSAEGHAVAAQAVAEEILRRGMI